MGKGLRGPGRDPPVSEPAAQLQQEVDRLKASLDALRTHERNALSIYQARRADRRTVEQQHAAAVTALRDVRASTDRAARLYIPRGKTYPLSALLQDLPASVVGWDIRDLHLRTRRNRVWHTGHAPTALRELSAAWLAGTLHELPLIYPDSSRMTAPGRHAHDYDYTDDDHAQPILRMVPIEMLFGEWDENGVPARFRFEANDGLSLETVLRAFPPDSQVPALALMHGLFAQAARYEVYRHPVNRAAKVEREGPAKSLTVGELRDILADPERRVRLLPKRGEGWSGHLTYETVVVKKSSAELLRLAPPVATQG